MAHVEYFGDLDGVARAKSELVAALPAVGCRRLELSTTSASGTWPRLSACPVLGYAVDADAEVRADDVTLDGDLRARFVLTSPWGTGRGPPGAARVATGPERAGRGDRRAVVRRPHRRGHRARWRRCAGRRLRMEVHHVPGGPVLVVDCYNANPASTEAALRSLAELPGEHKLAVLGVMAELGDETEPEHRRIALLAEELGIEVVGYETPLYGEAQVTGVRRRRVAVADDGPGRRSADQGEPGGAARGRRPGLRRGRGRAVAGRGRIERRWRPSWGLADPAAEIGHE